MSNATSEVCAWVQDGPDTDLWATECKHYFCITAGTPVENDMKFCCYCGKPLQQHLYEEEDHGDDAV